MKELEPEKSAGQDDPSLVPYGYRRVPGLEKKRLVREHFDGIARRYDLADTLMSLGLHYRWRRITVTHLGLEVGSRVLDLCGGTGDFAALEARLSDSGLTLVCDMNRPMMLAGREKTSLIPGGTRIHWVQGDAEDLCFPDCSFDAVTVGFGIRNLVDPDKGMREISRVLKPGGRVGILEFSIPTSHWLRVLYDWYSFLVMPSFGKLVTGRKEPFRYLAESVRTFPSPDKVAARLKAAGFRRVVFERLNGGLVSVYIGEK